MSGKNGRKSPLAASAKVVTPRLTPRGVRKRPQRIRQELLEKLPQRLAGPGDLNTVDDLQREWQRIHRAHWRDQLSDSEYSTLQYGMQTGVAITRIRDELAHAREELKHLEALRAKLEALQDQPGGLGLTFDRGDAIDVAAANGGAQS
jgi:hypothetical protein